MNSNLVAPALLDRSVTRRTLRDWLLTPRVAVLAALVLSLPALRAGWVADDYWHRSMLLHDGGVPMMHGGPLSLFTFASGNAADEALGLESGMFPWWTTPGFRMAFFRPIASLTHALDYALWPSSPAAMHLHSILWYVLGVALAGVLYRRLLDRVSSTAAAIATIFYAIDPTHGLPAGWIANRNSLIASVFAFCTLLVHDANAKKAARYWPWLAALTLGLALGSGECGLATVIYVAMYTVFLDRRPLATRAWSLVPSVLVTLGWATLYRLGHYGVFGSGIYHDPMRAPLAFLRGVVTNGPLLVATELGVPVDTWPALPTSAKIAVMVVALLLLGWGAAIVKRALFASNEDVRCLSRFFVAAGCVSVLPSTATFPSGRLLILPGFALVGVIAMICAGAVPSRDSRASRWFSKWCWFVHVTVAPVLFLITLHFFSLVQGVARPLAAGIPSDGSATHKRMVLVNAPDSVMVAYLMADTARRGGTPPERVLMMTGNQRDVRVERINERTMRVHEDGGFTRTGTELLFSEISRPLPVGTKIALSDVIITVTHAGTDGVPDEASFELTRDLDDAYVFRKWEGMQLVAFELPPVGTSITLEARQPQL